MPIGLALLLAGTGTTLAQAPPASAASQAETLGTRVDESAAITATLKAMQGADLPTLVQFYQNSNEPVAHIWAAMALERIHFNLDAASADARICEQDLFDSRPAMALLCGQFESGNLRLAGRTREADDKERELIQRYQGHGLDKQLAGMQTYQDKEAAIPGLIVERSPAVTSLPLKQDVLIPTFTAKANGHDFDLTLDTGASNLVLGADEAQAYGVKPLDQSAQVRGWLSKDVPAQRGLLDTLQIGTITLRHVPVTVVPRHIALIGANLVAPLGTLRLSRSSLVIGGDSAGNLACDTPMLVATDLWGRSLRVVPQLLINDSPQAVMLDTGASSYLLGTQAALDEATTLHRGKTVMADIGGTHAFANVRSAKVKLAIAGQPIEMYFAVYSDSSLRWPITLGAGALRDMDILLDFQHQHMCFQLHPNLH
jgi:predicted aspartyl protease